MTSITFTVPGKPVGWQRVGTGKYGQSYVPNETRSYQKHIAIAAKAAGVRLDDGPIRLLVQVYQQMPKSMPNKTRLLALHRVVRPKSKPDLDNVLKTVLDALNGIAYADDKQVTDIAASKFYGEPQIVVTVGAA